MTDNFKDKFPALKYQECWLQKPEISYFALLYLPTGKLLKTNKLYDGTDRIIEVWTETDERLSKFIENLNTNNSIAQVNNIVLPCSIDQFKLVKP